MALSGGQGVGDGGGAEITKLLGALHPATGLPSALTRQKYVPFASGSVV